MNKYEKHGAHQTGRLKIRILMRIHKREHVSHLHDRCWFIVNIPGDRSVCANVSDEALISCLFHFVVIRRALCIFPIHIVSSFWVYFDLIWNFCRCCCSCCWLFFLSFLFIYFFYFKRKQFTYFYCRHADHHIHTRICVCFFLSVFSGSTSYENQIEEQYSIQFEKHRPMWCIVRLANFKHISEITSKQSVCAKVSKFMNNPLVWFGFVWNVQTVLFFSVFIWKAAVLLIHYNNLQSPSTIDNCFAVLTVCFFFNCLLTKLVIIYTVLIYWKWFLFVCGWFVAGIFLFGRVKCSELVFQNTIY